MCDVVKFVGIGFVIKVVVFFVLSVMFGSFRLF